MVKPGHGFTIVHDAPAAMLQSVSTNRYVGPAPAQIGISPKCLNTWPGPPVPSQVMLTLPCHCCAKHGDALVPPFGVAIAGSAGSWLSGMSMNTSKKLDGGI